MHVDKTCVWCNAEEETLDHLLWSCTLAKQCWKFYHAWFQSPPFISRKVGQILSAMANGKEAQGRMICFSAIIWSIWIARNNKIFRGIKMATWLVKKHITNRAWEWSIKDNLLCHNQFKLWTRSPSDAYISHSQMKLHTKMKFWFDVSSLVGFIDGAITQDEQGNRRAGIGGFI